MLGLTEQVGCADLTIDTGSFVALALAERYSPRLGRLLLVGAGARSPEEGREQFRKLAARVEREGIHAVADAATLRLFPSDFLLSNPTLVEQRKQVFQRIDPAFFAAACRMLASVDMRSPVAGIANPTTILVGSLDAATPISVGRELAELMPRAELIELPGIGHAPQVQDADAFLRALRPSLGMGTPIRHN